MYSRVKDCTFEEENALSVVLNPGINVGSLPSPGCIRPFNFPQPFSLPAVAAEVSDHKFLILLLLSLGGTDNNLDNANFGIPCKLVMSSELPVALPLLTRLLRA